MTTHSKENALDDYEFERFLQGARAIDCDLRSLEARFVAFVGGRLGLRPGEICHMKGDWVNWRKRMIDIPFHLPCEKGKDGGICGYCRQQAAQRAEYSQLSLAEARLEALQEQLSEMPSLPGELQRQLQTIHVIHIDGDLRKDALDRQVEELLANAGAVDDVDEVREALDDVARRYQQENEVTQDEAEEQMWTAKTENAARSVPFDFDSRAELVLEQYFDRFDEWTRSRQAVNRRVDEALREADGLSEETTNPHGLRATAATHLAGKGLAAPALQAMFGWSQISTARRYIASTPDNTQRQLNQIQTR
ncbi:Phage integrase family protein [Natronoarchaeum philippinense]|uniref:Phage integrase family protein n=1 Tax=Natronoarchaeum philippinense TaxID=558529 RepID=A0A285PAF1_NATPI|nr:tyrosine-type recombinase/integrase [Natronoarchaeum philippinense]SNZ18193.1 Phage integrase family protein [Natronoarchaeum philippinense]